MRIRERMYITDNRSNKGLDDVFFSRVRESYQVNVISTLSYIIIKITFPFPNEILFDRQSHILIYTLVLLISLSNILRSFLNEAILRSSLRVSWKLLSGASIWSATFKPETDSICFLILLYRSISSPFFIPHHHLLSTLRTFLWVLRKLMLGLYRRCLLLLKAR